MNMIRKYGPTLATIHEGVWAIMPERLDEVVSLELSITTANDSGCVQSISAETRRLPRLDGRTAIIPVYGVLSQRMSFLQAFFGGSATDQIGAMVDMALEDDSVGTIVLDVDSPGGGVYGVEELSEKIYRSRAASGGKPIIAVANSLMASAAFWIGSAADRLVVTPGGEVGSVGVVAMHQDYSRAEEQIGRKTTFIYTGRYKVEGNPYEHLTDEARQAIQKRVDEYYTRFVDTLARNRKVSVQTVQERFGQGRVFGAAEAVGVGMADKIATLDEVLAELQRGPAKQKSPRAALTREFNLAKIRKSPMR